MRNLIRNHCKRFLFRWEAIAASLINLMIGIVSAVFIPPMYTDRFFGSEYFFPAFYLASLFCTMVSVILMEVNTLNNGTIRNQLIAGYTKVQIFLSKYITDFAYGVIQGILMMFMLPFSGIAGKYTILFAVSLVLIHGVVSCIVLTFCMLSERRTTSALLCVACLLIMALGTVQITGRLDANQYFYELSRKDYETVEKTENLFYISSPNRDILEQVARINPMQPIYEYTIWYLPHTYYQTNYYTKNNSRMDYDPVYRSQWPDIEAEYQRHTQRMAVFPYYQAGFLMFLCAVGALIFRKRNLK